MKRADLVEGAEYVVTGNENSHYYPIGAVVTFRGIDADGDAEFIGPGPTSSAPLVQYLRPGDIRPNLPTIDGLTTVQLSALIELRRQGSLRPSGKAFGGPNGARAFRRRTLQVLVERGHAEWRTSVRNTRHLGPVTYDGFITPTES